MYQEVLNSSNLTELSEKLKTFLASTPSAAEIKRLREAADEFHTAVRRAALIAGHPAWYAAAGRIAASFYLYQNWIMQHCREDNLCARNDLADTLSADILGKAETMIAEASAKEIMKYLDTRYDFSNCVLDEQVLLIFLIPNRHRTQDAFCRQLAFGDGSTGCDIYLFEPRHTSGTPESILFHELGHVLNTKLTGSTKIVPKSFFRWPSRTFPARAQRTGQMQQSFYALLCHGSYGGYGL